MIAISVARKPLIGSVAANAIRFGTGALNIDASRITYRDAGDHARSWDRTPSIRSGSIIYNASMQVRHVEGHEKLGRWPANLILEHRPECRRLGTKKVKPVGATRHAEHHAVAGIAHGNIPHDHPGFREADGTETVTEWECAPDCPVEILDAVAGPRWNGGNTGRAKAAGGTSWFTGAGLPPNGEIIPHGWGSASRFFKQVGGVR